ncbi:hypothetical protein I4U23_015666 [Adineta vaga]|nr:hypothetical protein I4U23_015666 [Adineta vaga]
MNSSLLLTDKQVQEFLINGYLILEPNSLDRDFHSTIFEQASSIFAKEGNPGNNILPRIPQLQYVFDDPTIHGALISLLGSNYTMQPHRHAHLTKPGSADQHWHKDSYFGYRKPLRHHQLRYVMAMYYAQDTTMEMGPTAIKPQTQYIVKDRETSQQDDNMSENNEQNDIYTICKAGTVVLIHYDIVHRGTANQTIKCNRFMFKFQFNRLEEPSKPTWNHDPLNAVYDAIDAGLLQPIVKHVWNWLLGEAIVPSLPPATNEHILEWETQLHHQDGKIRLNAAYNLALNNQYHILIQRLYKRKAIFCFEAANALTACRYNQDALKELQNVLKKEERNERVAYCIVFIFSEMGSWALEALPLIIHVMKTNDSWSVKQYCCEALGNIQSNEQFDDISIIKCLTNALSDRNEESDTKDASHVRLTAALSLAKLGAKAIEAIPSLKDALYFDSNRYVNGNALLALERIGTSEALNIVLNYLKTSRWCTKTTATSLF